MRLCGAEKRMKKSGSGHSESKPWIHSTQMEFLRDCSEPDASTSSIDIRTNLEGSSGDIDIDEEHETALYPTIYMSDGEIQGLPDIDSFSESVVVDIGSPSNIGSPSSNHSSITSMSVSSDEATVIPYVRTGQGHVQQVATCEGPQRKKNKKDHGNTMTSVEKFHEKFINVMENNLAAKRIDTDNYVTKSCVELVRGKVNNLNEVEGLNFMVKLVKLCSES